MGDSVNITPRLTTNQVKICDNQDSVALPRGRNPQYPSEKRLDEVQSRCERYLVTLGENQMPIPHSCSTYSKQSTNTAIHEKDKKKKLKLTIEKWLDTSFSVML
jgi:hypothetical protein